MLASHVQAGQLIAHRFRIVRALQRTRFQARDGRRHVAIELVPAAGRDLSKLRASIAVAATIDHPHLCRMREIVEHGEQLVIVSQLIDGVSIADRLMVGPFDPLQVGVLLGELLDALACAHAAGLAHGEVTTRTVVIDEYGKLRLLDLGIHSAGASPRGDLAAVALLARSMLTGSPATVPPQLGSWIDRCASFSDAKVALAALHSSGATPSKIVIPPKPERVEPSNATVKLSDLSHTVPKKTATLPGFFHDIKAPEPAVIPAKTTGTLIGVNPLGPKPAEASKPHTGTLIGIQLPPREPADAAKPEQDDAAGDATPSGSKVEAKSGATNAAGDAKAGDAKAGDAKAGNDAKAGGAKPGDAKSDDATSVDAASGARVGGAKATDADHAKAGDASSGGAKATDADHAKASDASSGDVKSAEAKAGDSKAGNDAKAGGAGNADATTRDAAPDRADAATPASDTTDIASKRRTPTVPASAELPRAAASDDERPASSLWNRASLAIAAVAAAAIVIIAISSSSTDEARPTPPNASTSVAAEDRVPVPRASRPPLPTGAVDPATMPPENPTPSAANPTTTAPTSSGTPTTPTTPTTASSGNPTTPTTPTTASSGNPTTATTPTIASTTATNPTATNPTATNPTATTARTPTSAPPATAVTPTTTTVATTTPATKSPNPVTPTTTTVATTPLAATMKAANPAPKTIAPTTAPPPTTASNPATKSIAPPTATPPTVAPTVSPKGPAEVATAPAGDGPKPSTLPIAPAGGSNDAPATALPPPPSSLPTKTILSTLQVPFSAESGWIEKPAVFVLEEAYRQLIKNPLARAEIAGHASTDGAEGKNTQLAFARGYAVRDYLVKRGIDPSRISVIAHRDTQPIAPNDTTDGRAQNRRAELRIVGP